MIPIPKGLGAALRHARHHLLECGELPVGLTLLPLCRGCHGRVEAGRRMSLRAA